MTHQRVQILTPTPGTTSREIVLMAREAGAKKVYFTSCAPPITYAHIYGIDLASSSELIAHHRDSAAIAKHIGADDVVYQNLEDLESACARLSPRDPKAQKFEVGVFCGKYVTPVDAGYFEHLEKVRGESRKQKVMEKAREAVVHGTANPQQIRMAAKGVVSLNRNLSLKSSKLLTNITGGRPTRKRHPLRRCCWVT